MSDVRRILDANHNRAREAARVMEEYARFSLNDAALAEACKTLRHALGLAVAGLGEPALIRSRDIVGDVGRDVTAEGEYERPDAAAVATAAAFRLSEALRSLEEYGKTLDSKFARCVESLRYDAYELQRRIDITAAARRRFRDVQLYVLITESLCRGDWCGVAEAALRGGADVLQLREKGLPERELIGRARKLVELCRRHDAMCIINDRPDVAAIAGADGVHLGQDDATVRDVRRLLPPRVLIGVSTHTVEQAAAAIADAPDYVAVGPMFDSPTKPQPYVAGPQTLASVRAMTGLPLAAIGGIDANRAAGVRAAGADVLCVCAAVIGDADPEAAARRLRQTLT